MEETIEMSTPEEQRIAEDAKDIRLLQQEITQLRATLAKRDNTIEHLDRRLKTASNTIRAVTDDYNSLRAQLAETQEKLREMEKESRDVPLCAHHAEVWFCERHFEPGDCWFCEKDKQIDAANERRGKAEEHYRAQHAQLFALQVHVGKLRKALGKIEVMPWPDSQSPYALIARAALRSHPDLTLIEEVRAYLEEVAECDEHEHVDCCCVSCRARQLLARLNPHKD